MKLLKMPTVDQHGFKYQAGDVQLNYKLFVDRLHIEQTMNRKGLRVIHFYLVIILFCLTLGTYDDVNSVRDVHDALAQRYKAADLKLISDVDGVMNYLDFFIKQTYGLASAMVDVNTFDTIDPARCFDPSVTDICRLTYWDVPDTDPSAPNYFNKTETVDLSIGRMGRYPERPIVLDTRLEYPTQMIVPLAPFIYQTRLTRVPCSGFGNVYNDEILGAGHCPRDRDCPAGTAVSSFAAGPHAGKLYLTYGEAAFFCVNPDLNDDVFFDKSWYPGASFTELKEGRRIDPQKIHGKRVFPKFVSDIAYLQAPIHPSLGGEPLNEDDLMWSDRSVSTNPRRAQWIQEYVASGSEDRKNTFVTRETSTLTVVSVVIIPQGENHPDIFTVASAEFRFTTYGKIEAKMEFLSTAETSDNWYIIASIFWLVALASLIDNAQRHIREWDNPKIKVSKLLRISDVVFAIVPVIYTVSLVLFDIAPPHIDAEFKAAFNDNSERRYMELIDKIFEYGTILKNIKMVGFFIGMAMVFRVILHLEWHPNFAIILNALHRCKSDCWHLFLAAAPIFLTMAFQAWWMFAQNHESAGFDTIPGSIRTTLTYMMPSVPGSFTNATSLSFCVWALTGLFVLRLFYLVLVGAIVKAFMGGKDAMSGSAGGEILSDAKDSLRMAFYRLKYKWPKPQRILEALEPEMMQRLQDGAAFEPNAVTPEEIAEVLGLDVDKTAQMLHHYSKKRLGEEGNVVLTETDPRLYFPPGEFRACASTKNLPTQASSGHLVVVSAASSGSLAGSPEQGGENSVSVNLTSLNTDSCEAALSPELNNILASAGVHNAVSKWLVDNGITEVFAFADLADSKSEIVDVVGRAAGLDPKDALQIQPLRTAWRRAEAYSNAQLDVVKLDLEAAIAERDSHDALPPAMITHLKTPSRWNPGMNWRQVDTQD